MELDQAKNQANRLLKHGFDFASTAFPNPP
jgi:hypothetical protein